MTTERAIEVINQFIDYRNGALKMPDGVELDKALSKAIEVMGESELEDETTDGREDWWGDEY